MHTWSFLTNTGAVLLLIAQQRPITAREIAERLALTEWPVGRITADLEAAGYLHKQCVGRAKHYEVNLALPLLQPVVCELAVGDVLPVLCPGSCGVPPERGGAVRWMGRRSPRRGPPVGRCAVAWTQTP